MSPTLLGKQTNVRAGAVPEPMRGSPLKHIGARGRLLISCMSRCLGLSPWRGSAGTSGVSLSARAMLSIQCAGDRGIPKQSVASARQVNPAPSR